MAFDTSDAPGSPGFIYPFMEDGGEIVLTGLGGPGMVSLVPVRVKELAIKWVWRRQPSSWRRAIARVKNRVITFRETIVFNCPLDEEEAAFRKLSDKEIMKAIIVNR